jgi:uncharacterized protein (DUF2252 family)
MPTQVAHRAGKAASAPVVPDTTRAERQAAGKEARKRVPRKSHAVWEPWSGRPDPVDLLEEQAKSRVPELVPIRYGRMIVSPFSFFRGAALQMATDLAHTPDSGLRVQACGDAHLANFGGFASPERELLFDLNDFDETLPGPWEWDVKRLAASLAVGGRARGVGRAERREVLLAATRSYREAMRRFAEMGNLEVWYSILTSATLTEALDADKAERRAKVEKRIRKATIKAETKDSIKAFKKLTTVVDGRHQIVSDPPLIVRAVDLMAPGEASEMLERLHEVLRRYRATLPDDRRHLIEGYRLVDIARKVVGVGSVGTRCWIVLLEGRTTDQDPLFLQVKEAEASVLEPFVGKSRFVNHGRRVVEGQRLMQAASDIMLGWLHTDGGLDGHPRDFYVRQLWDWKYSARLDTASASLLHSYAQMCAWTLARAHARSGDRVAIAAYLGGGDQFDQAIAAFAEAYADQNEHDYESLVAAVKAGRVKAQTGV